MNKLIKALVYDNQLSCAVLDTTDMVNKAISIFNLTPVCAAAFGRTITVCTFMASGLKNAKDKLSVTVKGDGPCGKITVCGNKDLQMRGYMDNPHVDLPLKANGKLDVGGCVGKNGRITVIKSMGLKEPYSGSSQLISGEIGEDFTSYYALSEQQPTAIAVGVKIGKNGKCVGAGGVIFQALPFAEDKNLQKAEQVINGLNKISTLIEEKGAEGVFLELFGNAEREEYKPVYKCLCSKKYIEGILVSLGKKEIDDIIDKEGSVKVSCEFCGKTYEFTRDDAERIFGK